MFSDTEHGTAPNASALLDAAAEQLRAHGLQVDIAEDHGNGADVVIRTVTGRRGSQAYIVEVKHRINAELATAIHVPANRPMLVVAPHVGDAAAEVLRTRRIDYVDTAGNMRLAWDGLLIDQRGRKPPRAVRRWPSARAARAFSRSGLQAQFVLLGWPELAVQPLRALANASGVSLGTAQMVVEELSAAGYLYEGPSGRALARGGELLSRWSEAYTNTLAPALVLAGFAADDLSWWPESRESLTDDGVQVGGDPHLRPSTLTLYAPQVPARLVARHRWARRDHGGNVMVRRRFWRVPDDESWLVPTPLIYADLIASGDPRQRDHADRLRKHDDRLTRLDRS